MLLINSEMIGLINLKLGGMVKGMGENFLAKDFFLDRSKLTGVRSVGHGCLF